MLNEIMNNGAVLAVLGVIVGFFLSEFSSAYKKIRERRDAKI